MLHQTSNELNLLSLVDSIWMIHAFDSLSARYIELDIHHLLNHKTFWTFDRFKRGVATMNFKFCAEIGTRTTDAQVESSNCNIQTRNNQHTEHNQTTLFEDSFSKIASISDVVNIHIVGPQINASSKVAKLFDPLSKNHFARTKKDKHKNFVGR